MVFERCFVAMFKYKEPYQVILIINQASEKEFKRGMSAFKWFYAQLPIFPLKKSAAFSWMIEVRIPISELAEKHPLHARYYRVVAEQFNRLFYHMLDINADTRG